MQANGQVALSAPLPGAHLSNSGFSPQSKESCRSLTRLAWPGMRKRPSSVSPRSRMKSTHCSTSRGARRGPYFRSWCTVSSRRCPKTPGHREELVTPSASRRGGGGGRWGQQRAGGAVRAKGGSPVREQVRNREGSHQGAGTGQEGIAGRGLAWPGLWSLYKPEDPQGGPSGSMHYAFY